MAITLNASTQSGLVVSPDQSGLLQLQTAGTTAVTIDTSQRVGIGVTSPSVPFQVQAIATNGYTARFNGRSSDNYSELTFYNNANSTNYGVVGADQAAMYIGTNASLPVILTTASTERMRIDSSGNFLVKKTANTASADNNVGALLSATGKCIFEVSGDRALILNRLNDNGIIQEFFRGAGNQVGNINAATSSVSYNTTSDYRLKDNIAPMTGALAKVQSLKPVTYKWKVDGTDAQGFIAHELQAVVPDCVTGEKDAVDENGKPVYQSIDTSFLVATLTAAIQELKAELDTVKSELATLKGQA